MEDLEGINEMSMWIVYDPDTATVLDKFYTLKKAKEQYFCRNVNRFNGALPKYMRACAKVDMKYYDQWYTMVLLKAKNFNKQYDIDIV